MAEQIIFYILATIIVVFSIFTVSTKRIVRSATYLLFVLLATAGLYLLLGYQYLMGVQIAVYAGGVMVLFIFAILLTHKPGEEVPRESIKKRFLSGLLAVAGLVICAGIVVTNVTKVYNYVSGSTVTMKDVGIAMMGTEKYQYLLSFEAISLLLLACIVGGIMIARRR